VSVDLAAAVSGVFGSLTNTVGVLGLAVVFGYLPPAAVVPIIPQAIAEAVLAAVVTVVVVRGVLLYRSGRTTAPEIEPDEEKRY
ncbi:MAG: ECF transporter S component, partial [Actinomycetota bacterium]|nr:ECF transporter S component [Actinomycetota bacterium]